MNDSIPSPPFRLLFFSHRRKKKEKKEKVDDSVTKERKTKRDPLNIAEIIETTTTGEQLEPFRSMWELPPFTRQMRIEDALAILLRNPFLKG